MIKPSESFEGMSCTICTTFDCNLRCKYDVAKGTKILMSTKHFNSTMVVEDVRKGYDISSFDEKTGEIEDAKVIDCGYTRTLTSYYVLSIALKAFETREIGHLILSGEHPIYASFDNNDYKFVKTEELYNILKSNDKSNNATIKFVNQIGDGRFGVAELSFEKKDFELSLIENGKPIDFYNLTTSNHTFIANGVFVHNCYEQCKRSVRIDIDTVYKFIDRILEDPDPIASKGTPDSWIPKSGIILDFIGGDSFMTPDIMDKALTYFQYKVNMLHHPYANRWRACISSNGTLFGSPDVQRLLEKWGNNLSIGISIDGCPEIHDANRIFTLKGKNGEELGSMSTIMKWWPWVAERFPDAVRSTKSTCSKNSIPWLYKSLKFMHEPYPEGLGITYINQNFIMEDTGCKEDDYVLLDEEYRRCARYLWDHRHEMYWSMLDKHGVNLRSDNFAEYEAGLDRGWCGSGAMPSVAMNGNIYPCFRWLPHTMQDDVDDAEGMVVGTADKGFIHKDRFRIVKEATQRKISSHYCLDCEYSQGCAYCIGGCYAEFHEFKRTEHICYITKLRNKWSRRYWDMTAEFDMLETDYFTFTDYDRSMTETPGYKNVNNDAPTYDEVTKTRIFKYGNDGKLLPQFRTKDNPSGEPQLTIPDLPKEYENVWKYNPSKVIQDGDTNYMHDNILAPNMEDTSYNTTKNKDNVIREYAKLKKNEE